ncbi:hypothetical protein PR048_016853 [Dryococelus australis]|uniref:Uncharacterized protein n=1 Tax=Dryococelus australis TaxID=614101 RepID=A0ABQ9H7U5_9NEOP|nr:hypothetical protein PR048_016853 [Dryococelus australis]
MDSEQQCRTVSSDFVIIGFPGLPPTMVANFKDAFASKAVQVDMPGSVVTLDRGKLPTPSGAPSWQARDRPPVAGRQSEWMGRLPTRDKPRQPGFISAVTPRAQAYKHASQKEAAGRKVRAWSEVSTEQRWNERCGNGNGKLPEKNPSEQADSSRAILACENPGSGPAGNRTRFSLVGGEVAPGFSHVGIVPDDADGRRVLPGGLPFPPPLHSGAAPYTPRLTLIGSQDLAIKSRQNDFSHFLVSHEIKETSGEGFVCTFVIGGRRSEFCHEIKETSGEGFVCTFVIGGRRSEFCTTILSTPVSNLCFAEHRASVKEKQLIPKSVNYFHLCSDLRVSANKNGLDSPVARPTSREKQQLINGLQKRRPEHIRHQVLSMSLPLPAYVLTATLTGTFCKVGNDAIIPLRHFTDCWKVLKAREQTKDERLNGYDQDAHSPPPPHPLTHHLNVSGDRQLARIMPLRLLRMLLDHLAPENGAARRGEFSSRSTVGRLRQQHHPSRLLADSQRSSVRSRLWAVERSLSVREFAKCKGSSLVKAEDMREDVRRRWKADAHRRLVLRSGPNSDKSLNLATRRAPFLAARCRLVLLRLKSGESAYACYGRTDVASRACAVVVCGCHVTRACYRARVNQDGRHFGYIVNVSRTIGSKQTGECIFAKKEMPDCEPSTVFVSALTCHELGKESLR